MTQGNSPAVSMQDKINHDLKEILSKEKVGFKIPQLWYEMAYKALKYFAPITLGFSVAQYKDLVRKITQESRLNYYEFGGINNKLEELTPDQLSVDMALYIKTMELVEQLAVDWNKETEEMRNKVIGDMVESAKNIERVQL